MEPNAGRAVLLLIVLAGIALRIYRLDAQSFWYDEGNSARIAERSLQLIIAGAAGDIHPPLYYIALHYWRALFGESEFALRMLSVLCGVGLLIFTYLLARRLFTPRAGLIAAALVALSPFAVYYSQEARMYVMLAFEAAVSTWALCSILDFRFWILDRDGNSRFEIGDWGNRTAISNLESRISLVQSKIQNRKSEILLYVLSTAAGLYTQYAYPFVMIAQGMAVLVWLIGARGKRTRALAIYAAINVVAIVLFAPWLPIAIRQVTSWSVTPQSYQVGQAMLDAYRWLVVGRTLPLDQATLPLVAVGALALLGVLFGMLQRDARARRVLPTMLLLLLVITPFALLFVFHLYREAYLKFLLVCAAPLLILAARGIDGLASLASPSRALPEMSDFSQKSDISNSSRGGAAFGHWVRTGIATVLTLGMLALWWPSLQNLYTNSAYARDDYRGIARTIEADARPRDAVLLNAPNQWEVFTYYHRQGAPSIPLTYHPANMPAVDEQMQPIAAQYVRLFVLYYGENESDPGAGFERWLAEHAFKADEQWIGNIRLAVYAAHSPIAAIPLTATFGDGIMLENVSVDLGEYESGEIIPLRLTWQADAQVAQRYKVFVHVGGADAPPVAQNDSEPAAGTRPTDTWKAGEQVVDQRGVWLKPGLAPGSYGLYVGVYDSATGKRLPVQSQSGRVVGDRLWLGDVTVR